MPWLKCKKCGNVFIVPAVEFNPKKLPKCPKCGSKDIQDEDYYNQ